MKSLTKFNGKKDIQKCDGDKRKKDNKKRSSPL